MLKHPAGTFCAGLGTAAAISAFFGVSLSSNLSNKQSSDEEEDEHHFVNWSNTHEAFPRYLFEPQTENDLQTIMARAHRKGKHLET